MAGKLQLNDLVTTISGKVRGLFAWPTVIVGMNGDTPVPIAVNSDGSLSSAAGTYVFTHVANSGSTTIPTTAKRWSVNFIGTGTGNTFGTNTAVTGGQGFSDNAAPAVAIDIVCDGSTVADIFYSTT